jgi:tape measure domain-containing protein
VATTTDLQRLIVSFEANIKGYERSLNKALGVTNARSRTIERRFKSMQQSLNSTFARVGGAIFSAAAARGAQLLIDASTRITNALKIAGLEGQALSDVYDALYASAQKNAAPLESLVTLYGRAAIVQKELNISTEELLQFTNNVAVALRVAGTDAQSASGALLQLSQALGSGVVRAEEFNSILEGALPIAQAAAKGLEEAGGSVAKLRALVVDGKVSSEAFFRAFEAGSVSLQRRVGEVGFTIAQGFQQIQNALIDAAGRMNEGSKGGEELAKALGMIAQGIRDTDFGPFAAEIARFIEDVRNAKNEVVGLYQAWIDFKRSAADRLRGVLGSSNQERIDNAFDRAAGSLTPVTGGAASPSAGGPSSRGGNRRVNRVSLADFALPSEDGKKTRENAWQRETRQIQEATRALQQELTLVGQTEFARDKARAVLELENAARREGIKLTGDQKIKVDEMATAYAMAAESVRQAKDRFEAINALQREFGQLAIDGIQGLIDESMTLNDVLATTLKRLADLALQAAILGDGPFASLFGGKSSNGGVGGLIGGIGKLFGGFFANGGTLGAGRWGIAGENGPEIIKGPAQVIPNTALKKIGGGTSAPTVNVSIDARGADPTSVAKLQAMRGQIVREAVSAAVAAVPKTAGGRPGYYGSGQ